MRAIKKQTLDVFLEKLMKKMTYFWKKTNEVDENKNK